MTNTNTHRQPLPEEVHEQPHHQPDSPEPVANRLLTQLRPPSSNTRPTPPCNTLRRQPRPSRSPQACRTLACQIVIHSTPPPPHNESPATSQPPNLTSRVRRRAHPHGRKPALSRCHKRCYPVVEHSPASDSTLFFSTSFGSLGPALQGLQSPCCPILVELVPRTMSASSLPRAMPPVATAPTARTDSPTYTCCFMIPRPWRQTADVRKQTQAPPPKAQPKRNAERSIVLWF